MYSSHEQICSGCILLCSEEKQRNLINVYPISDYLDGSEISPWIMTIELKWQGKPTFFHCLGTVNGQEYCRYERDHKILYSKLNPRTRKITIKLADNE